MDKRWIGIILILLAGLSCMYVIVTHSTSVGSAVSVIEDVTITVPHGFITSEDGADYCVFHNKDTNETVRMKCLNDKNTYINEYNKQLTTLKEKGDIKIKNNFKNNTLSLIEYENQSTTDKKYVSVIYFYKCNHTFSMKMEQFTDENSKQDVMDFIIDTLKFDFKQRTS